MQLTAQVTSTAIKQEWKVCLPSTSTNSRVSPALVLIASACLARPVSFSGFGLSNIPLVHSSRKQLSVCLSMHTKRWETGPRVNGATLRMRCLKSKVRRRVKEPPVQTKSCEVKQIFEDLNHIETTLKSRARRWKSYLAERYQIMFAFRCEVFYTQILHT